MSSESFFPLRLAAAACFTLLSAACGREAPPAPEPRLVRTVVVSGGSSGASTTYTAEIRSRLEMDLSFQVGGKIVSRAVDVGANVRKGQVLAQIDQTDQRLGHSAADEFGDFAVPHDLDVGMGEQPVL